MHLCPECGEPCYCAMDDIGYVEVDYCAHVCDPSEDDDDDEVEDHLPGDEYDADWRRIDGFWQ
jgi:hypothetical protein